MARQKTAKQWYYYQDFALYADAKRRAETLRRRGYHARIRDTKGGVKLLVDDPSLLSEERSRPSRRFVD